MSLLFQVYEICDPITSIPFFIGIAPNDVKVEDYWQIDPERTVYCKTLLDNILTTGNTPEVNPIKNNLTQDAAVHLEKALIRKHGRIYNTISGKLTNTKRRKPKKGQSLISGEYSTLQIHKEVKDTIADVCQFKGYRIANFVETVMLSVISGSLSGSFWR